MERTTKTAQKPQPSLCENPCMIPDLQSLQSAAFCQAVQQLQRIFDTQRNESAKYPDDLPTSFVDVEREIARCISGCLCDVPSRNRDISHIQSLLRDYKVVGFVPGQTPSVSLERVYLILQDNYAGSSLCGLFNIFLAEFHNVQTKVITIY